MSQCDRVEVRSAYKLVSMHVIRGLQHSLVESSAPVQLRVQRRCKDALKLYK